MATLIAACGLDCSKCEAFIATQANDLLALEAVAEKWRVEYHAPGISAENIWCDGCMAGGRTAGNCLECKIRLCAIEHSFQTCAECGDYPCEQLAGFFKMVPAAKDNLDSLRK